MNRKRLLLCAALLLSAALLDAQTFSDGFFLQNYRLGYRYNPAIMSEGSFVSTGEFSSSARNNVGAAAFLYPRDGKLVTALHPSVTAEDFLGSLSDDNYTQSLIDYNLLSYGFRKGEVMHTFELNARGMYGISIPKEIFSIAKLGTSAAAYDLAGIRAQGNLYAELAYGYSRRLSDRLSVGARAKLLLGLYGADYNVTRLDVTMTEDEYVAAVDADMDLTSRTGKIHTDDAGFMDFTHITAKGKWGAPTGAGAAFDLGVVYTPTDGLTLSASLLDLGGILWYYGNAAKSSGTATFKGLSELSYDEMNADGISEELKEVGDAFLQTLNLTPAEKKCRFKAVPLQANLAARYALPFCSWMSAGASATFTSFQGRPYRDCRFNLEAAPLDWLDLSGNIGTGSFGPVFGLAAAVRVLNFRINAGLQNGFGGTVPYTSTPLQANSKTVTIGVTYDI